MMWLCYVLTGQPSYNPMSSQYVFLLPPPLKDCEAWHRARGIKLTLNKEMVCAGHKEGGRDACQGDSGGPLMTRDDSGQWRLIGLVSAGYSCAKPGQPGIYHRLAETLPWLKSVINS